MSTVADRAVYNAIAKNDWSTARWYASQGKGLDYVHMDGNTLLHLAAKGNNSQLVKLLLERGADARALNQAEQTPVFLAAYYCASADIMKLLLDAGGDVNQADKQGWTPLHAATFRNASAELVALLLARGADKTKTVGASTKTALDFARVQEKRYDQPELVTILRAEQPQDVPGEVREDSLASVSSERERPSSIRSNPSSMVPAPASTRPVSSRTHSVRSSSSSIYSAAQTLVMTEADDEQPLVVTTEGVNEMLSTPEVVAQDAQVTAELSNNTESKSMEEMTVYISYGLSQTRDGDKQTKDRVSKLAASLRSRGYQVLLNESPSNSQSALFRATKEISSASAVIACITPDYLSRVHMGSQDAGFFDVCAQEFTESLRRLGRNCVIPIALDSKILQQQSWRGPVGMLLHDEAKRTLDFSSDELLEAAVDGICLDLAAMFQ